MIREKKASKAGLHFSRNPRFSQQQSDVLVKCGDYTFHIPPTKEDFEQLPHLGHLDQHSRNPKTCMSLSKAKQLLQEYTGLKEPRQEHQKESSRSPCLKNWVTAFLIESMCQQLDSGTPLASFCCVMSFLARSNRRIGDRLWQKQYSSSYYTVKPLTFVSGFTGLTGTISNILLRLVFHCLPRPFPPKFYTSFRQAQDQATPIPFSSLHQGRFPCLYKMFDKNPGEKSSFNTRGMRFDMDQLPAAPVLMDESIFSGSRPAFARIRGLRLHQSCWTQSLFDCTSSYAGLLLLLPGILYYCQVPQKWGGLH